MRIFSSRLFWFLYASVVAASFFLCMPREIFAAYHFAQFKATPPIHLLGSATKVPMGMTPTQIKNWYHLPTSGGMGTIAIVGAYYDSTIEHDLEMFDTAFGLPQCTVKNGCLTQHVVGTGKKQNSGWAMETALDVEWAHAIAPSAKILLVEAPTPSGVNLLKAIDYARAQKGVVAVSMSWGGAEFSDETSLDSHFDQSGGVQFFASSGDNGTGASWPAASPQVIAVGGTSLVGGEERAWTGSGGGISAYEPEPDFQKSYSIAKAGGHRAIPDVAYNADPKSGFPIYKSAASGKGAWYVVGGTSAGAPQWAAIAALGGTVTAQQLYQDKAATAHATYFYDITSGSNGDCGYLCDARKKYDYVTGLGAPRTSIF